MFFFCPILRCAAWDMGNSEFNIGVNINNTFFTEAQKCHQFGVNQF